MLKVLGIGDNVCDKYTHSKMMYPGGQALNFSVYTKMLGAESSYMGVFGSDYIAEHIIKTLANLQIEHSRCRHYKGENGWARIGLVNGNRVFFNSNKGGVLSEYPIQLNEEDIKYIQQFSIVHTSNNSYFNAQLPRLKKERVIVSYDFSSDWSRQEVIEEVAPYVTYAFISCGSIAENRVKKICTNIFSYGCKIVIATRGELGSIAYDGMRFYSQASKKMEVVDTLGAGDSFMSAFLLSITEDIMKNSYNEFSIKKAMEKGTEFASKICMKSGAFGYGIPFFE